MARWIRWFEYIILIGLIALVGIGVVSWLADYRQWSVPTDDVSAAAMLPISPQPSPSFAVTATATRLPPTMTPAPTWTMTPTPTEMVPPTATPTPSPTPTVTPTPAPLVLPAAPTPVLVETVVVTSTLPQPTPMPLISQPEGTINILLLGSDRRDGEDIARTDVMMLVSIFPDIPSVSVMSIPRDYYAWIPMWGLDKINTAYLRGHRQKYPGGGPAALKATIEYNFGVPVHYYALVAFSGYQSIVDALGGVDIVVECPFHDTYPDSDSETGATDIDLEPGVHHLDGKYALWYVRSRWNTSDFDRHRRQQQVVRAIYVAAKTQNLLSRIPDLWEAYQGAVETDLGIGEVVYLASLGKRLDEGDIKSRFIRGKTLLTSMVAPNGGAVLAPNHDALYEFVSEAVQPPLTSRALQRAHRVEVLNGTGNAGWGHVAAYRLGLEGFEVVSVEASAWSARTTIVDYTTTNKGSPLYKLLALYKRQVGDVVSQPTEGSAADFRVVLGVDYNPCLGTGTAYWRPTPTPSPIP